MIWAFSYKSHSWLHSFSGSPQEALCCEQLRMNSGGLDDLICPLTWKATQQGLDVHSHNKGSSSRWLWMDEVFKILYTTTFPLFLGGPGLGPCRTASYDQAYPCSWECLDTLWVWLPVCPLCSTRCATRDLIHEPTCHQDWVRHRKQGLLAERTKP